MAESVRKLRVELGAGIAGFQKGMAAAGKATRGLSAELSGLNKGLTAGLKDLGTSVVLPLTAAFAAVGGAVALATKQTIDYSSAIVDVADRSGHTVEWLQATKFAAEQSGTSLEAVTKASEKLRKTLGEGSRETVKTVEALGLSFRELREASPDEQMNTLLGAIGKIEDPTTRTTVAMELLGKSGGALIPLAANFEDLRARAEELGLVMAEKDVRAAEALGDRLDAMQSAFGGLVRSVGAAITSNASLHELIEGLAEIFGTLSKTVNGNREGMASFVSSGVIFVAKALVGLTDVLQISLDVWDGLRLTWATLELGAINLGLALSKASLALANITGDTEESARLEGVIRGLEEEKIAVGRTAEEIISANTRRTNALAALRTEFVELEKRVEAAAGKEADLGEQTAETTEEVELQGKAAEKLADAARKLGEDLDAALAQAGSEGLVGLDAAFAKVETDAAKWSDRLAELVREGLDPASAAAFRAEIEELTAALRANALEAERQRLLGQTFQDLAKEAQAYRDVLDATGNDLSQLTDESLAALEKRLTGMVKAGAPLAGTLDLVRKRMEEVGLATTETARRSEAYHERVLHLETLREAAEEAELERVEGLREAWQSFYSDLAGVADLLGSIGFEGTASSILDAVGFMEQFDAAAEDGVLAWGEMASMVGSVVQSIQRATESASAMTRALQTGLQGAAIGAKVGGLFGPIGTAIGAAAGAIGGAIFGALSKPKWVKEAEAVGKEWGVAISDELAKQIEKDAERLGDSVAARLANLPAIIEEAGGIEAFGVEKATDAARDLFSQIETGKLSVEEAGGVFDEVFGQLAPAAIDKTTGLASEGFLELIDLSKRFGVESEAVNGFLDQQRTKLGAGLEAVAKGAVISANSSAGVGAAAVAQFQMLRESGLSAKDALDQMQPTIDALRDKFAEAGVSGGAAFDGLAAQSALLHDEVAGPLLEAITGAGDAIVALANSGALTQESFGGLSASIGETFAKLQEEGKSGPEALALIQPSLQATWEAQQRFGFAVDASTQAMLDEAVASGAVGEAHKSASERMVDATTRVADVLTLLAEHLGVTIPEAAKKGAQGVEDAFAGVEVDIPVNFAPGELPPGATPAPPVVEPLPLQTGGVGDFGAGTLAMLHGREWVIPDEDLAAVAGGGDTFNLEVKVDNNPLQTAETTRQMNDHFIRLLRRDMGRGLADAVAAGRA